MEFVIELLLTAVVALLFSFLIAKLITVVNGGADSSHVDSQIVMEEEEELQCSQQLLHESKVEGFVVSQKRVAFVQQTNTDFNCLLVGESGVDSLLDIENDDVVTVKSPIESVDKESGVESLLDDQNDDVTFLAMPQEEDVESETLHTGIDDVAGFVVLDEEEEEEVKEEEELGKGVIEQESETQRIQKIQVVVDEENNEKAGIDQESETQCIQKIQKVVNEDNKEKSGINQESETQRIKEAVVDEDDDWEGIERSDLENTFAAASKFVNSGGDLVTVGSDVQMELYGLHKVATEGPCRESQPMALMMSARAKWNAWQRLGNMSPELAMEQYISVLSEKDPSWMEEHSVVMGDSKQEHLDSGMCTSKDPSTTLVAEDSPSANEHTTEMKPNSEGAEVTSGSSVENQGKEDENSS